MLVNNAGAVVPALWPHRQDEAWEETIRVNLTGPYLVTPDEVDDVLDLDMWLDIDGERKQTGSTSTMIFSPTFIVHYLSQFLALEPGDLINTGTPPGVGIARKPPVLLKAGDVVEVEIEKIGVLKNPCVSES